MSVTVLTKGSSGKLGMDCVLAFIEECGDGNSRVIIKTDQERSIELLVNDLVNERTEGQTVVE
jgi:hypothetical protein